MKSAIFFSMFLIILSRPLARNVPELVRTLNMKVTKGITYEGKFFKYNNNNNNNERKLGQRNLPYSRLNIDGMREEW